ncbi:MAG TPA: TRAP transporter substrate-binding protein DctP [Casimicrobiaceae bacterium]|nr:TRAP transporter substrate-binding protein DctP [Casimicrobiaceae bacterium]
MPTPAHARNTSATRRRVLGAGCALALLPAFAGVAAETAEHKLSVASGPALPLGKAAERWAASLREPGDGAIAVKLFPGAGLAGRDPARELLALAEGRADLAVGSTLQWALQVPALGVFSLPWIAPQDTQLLALAQDATLHALLAARLAAAGVHLVALAPLGYREIAAVKAVRAPADLAGLRLRAIASPLLQDVLRALGAAPQTMSFVQAQAAFASGQLDGQEGPPTSLAAGRVVASGHGHVTDLGGVAEVMAFAVRTPVWSAWTRAQRDRAAAAASRAIADTDAMAREQAARGELAAQGATVLRLTAAGQQAFRAAARDADRRWRDVVGADVVEAAERALAAPAQGSAPPVAADPVPPSPASAPPR